MLRSSFVSQPLGLYQRQSTPLTRHACKTRNRAVPVLSRVSVSNPLVRSPAAGPALSQQSRPTTHHDSLSAAPQKRQQNRQQKRLPLHEQPALIDAYKAPASDVPGVARAVGLIAMWALVFRHAVWGYDLTADITLPHLLEGVTSFAALEFLSTGLFITTHDAMHTAVAPNNKTLNDIIGSLCVNLYAWFDYKLMHKKHWEHHNECGTPNNDPDFHKGDPNLLTWYTGFMKSYMSIPQFVKLQTISMGLMHLSAPLANLLLFWTGAGMVSAIRLFYFGTYEPHKPDAEAWEGEGDGSMPWWKARTSDANRLLSFLRCYHFDYHWEHHRWPTAPWWDLPRARDVKNAFAADITGAPTTPAKETVKRKEQSLEGELVPAFEGMARSVSRELSRGLSSCLESVASLSSVGSLDLAYASFDI